MILSSPSKPSAIKNRAIVDFSHHVSSAEVAFFQKYGMAIVMGSRKGSYGRDIDGGKRLFNLHRNGGVFNLGHRHIELIEVLKDGLDDCGIGNHHLMSKARADLAIFSRIGRLTSSPVRRPPVHRYSNRSVLVIVSCPPSARRPPGPIIAKGTIWRKAGLTAQ